MGGRVHGETGWAKLASLAEGAALATKALWRYARLTCVIRVRAIRFARNPNSVVIEHLTG
jgi:hypothetical protein